MSTTATEKRKTNSHYFRYLKISFVEYCDARTPGCDAVPRALVQVDECNLLLFASYTQAVQYKVNQHDKPGCLIQLNVRAIF